MSKTKQAVYIVDGLRTPFIKAKGKPNPLSASDLAVMAARSLLARQPFKPDALDEVVVGCVCPAPDEVNIGRLLALRLGCGDSVMGYTVQRNCASGLQALDSAYQDITLGRHDLVLAGGTECMSRTPLLFSDAFVEWLANFKMSKTWGKKIKNLMQFRPRFVMPVVSLLKGLTDPYVNLSMGQTAEILSAEFNISREEMDLFAVSSHEKALLAKEQRFLNEITPLYDWQGDVIEFDDGVRQDSTLEKLSKLKPVFDKPFGNVTAGNSSQVSDGAAFLILASEAAVKQYHLKVLGKIVDTAWAALNPSVMGLGPVHAIANLLFTHHLSLQDIDYWEINEAFAAQVLACLNAMNDQEYCKTELKLPQALGVLDKNRLNVDGGAIAVGHPVGASGARLVLHLLQVLKRHHARRGIASLCIGGGQGGAMLLERVGED